MKFELNTNVLPVVSTDLYSLSDMLYDFEFESISEIDDGVIEVATPIIQDTLSDILPSAIVTPIKVWHPKAYNFATDEFEFSVSVDDAEYEDLKSRTLSEADVAFYNFLRKNYKSYDGFISYMASDAYEFEEQDEWRKFCQIVMFYVSQKQIDHNNENFVMDLWEYMSDNFDRIYDEDGEY